ncbi:uncharacterized protein LOC131857667 [Cryptomeria japonica]|uniref:uncharacterized protein LOC131857667 n=1 Tax=Cryptomeria japonica TaxID=3369 RepID=UPI0027DAAE3B|nr:uncharacterized protein LOC131857667 [Cryptomeria japonica]
MGYEVDLTILETCAKALLDALREPLEKFFGSDETIKSGVNLLKKRKKKEKYIRDVSKKANNSEVKVDIVDNEKISEEPAQTVDSQEAEIPTQTKQPSETEKPTEDKGTCTGPPETEILTVELSEKKIEAELRRESFTHLIANDKMRKMEVKEAILELAKVYVPKEDVDFSSKDSKDEYFQEIEEEQEDESDNNSKDINERKEDSERSAQRSPSSIEYGEDNAKPFS